MKRSFQQRRSFIKQNLQEIEREFAELSKKELQNKTEEIRFLHEKNLHLDSYDNEVTLQILLNLNGK